MCRPLDYSTSILLQCELQTPNVLPSEMCTGEGLPVDSRRQQQEVSVSVRCEALQVDVERRLGTPEYKL